MIRMVLKAQAGNNNSLGLRIVSRLVIIIFTTLHKSLQIMFCLHNPNKRFVPFLINRAIRQGTSLIYKPIYHCLCPKLRFNARNLLYPTGSLV